ncbi:hypothetical protein SAY86_030041 [Trapa natans]|uniref:Small ribosomal subunit protein uS7 domain-containing protein n=1 Tax=Trapa natans TaxID=22666 RepID=A0AAN7M287_TRANT|nr:hypothetical protein SAY86_030041 [Trapa natans]
MISSWPLFSFNGRELEVLFAMCSPSFESEKNAFARWARSSRNKGSHDFLGPSEDISRNSYSPLSPMMANPKYQAAAVKLQKVYKSFRTRWLLADCALLDFAELKRSSISFFDIERPETAISRWWRVGKGLSKDEKARKLALQHWLEAVERKAYEVVVEAGKFLYRQTGKLLDTREGPEGAKWIIVLSTSKILYVGLKNKGTFQHSSFLAGGATLSAGRLVVEEGILKAVWPHSGHYLPTEENFQELVSFLEEEKVDLSDVKKFSTEEEEATLFRRVSNTISCHSQEISSREGHQRELLRPAPVHLVMEDDLYLEDQFMVSKPNLFDEKDEDERIIPREKIMRRIDSHKGMKSYQLAQQLSCKWTSGAGPRIGCMRDYPTELQAQVLQQANLSPRAATVLLRSPRPAVTPPVSAPISAAGRHPSRFGTVTSATSLPSSSSDRSPLDHREIQQRPLHFSLYHCRDLSADMAEATEQTQQVNDVKLFNRWSFEDIQMNDVSLIDYIAVQPAKHATYVPHTAGRYSMKRFRKAQCPIVERLTNSLMMHGRNNGKKLMAVRIIKHAMEIIHLLTDQNPIQVIVDAVINSGPREDATRIGSAGVVRRQAVDISPLRRVNQAIYLLTTGAREAAFRNIKTIAECLADELINAAKGSSNSYAIKKKDEIERVAKANR